MLKINSPYSSVVVSWIILSCKSNTFTEALEMYPSITFPVVSEDDDSPSFVEEDDDSLHLLEEDDSPSLFEEDDSFII